MATLVLSDIHICNTPGLFQRHEALASFLDHAAKRPGTPQVIFAGDTFDFIALPGYERLVPARSADHMRAILDSASNQRILQALGSLVDAGAQVVFMPGNHDPELSLPAVQDVLSQEIHRKASVARGTIKFHPGGEAYEVQTDGGAVWIDHGNKQDLFNDIDYPALLRAAQERPEIEFPLCPGSKIVTRIVNRFKPRFPWIDRFQSYDLIVTLLWYCLDDPAELISALKDALGIGSDTLLAALERMRRSGGHLGPDDRTSAPSVDEQFAAMIMNSLLPADPLELTGEQELWVDKVVNPPRRRSAPRPGALAGAADRLWAKVIYRLLSRAASASRAALDPGTEDGYEDQLVTRAPDGAAALLLGHTHCAKDRWLGSRRYLNTGTWAELTDVPALPDEQAAMDWLGEVMKGAVPSFARLSYVEIDPEGGPAISLKTWPSDTPAHSTGAP